LVLPGEARFGSEAEILSNLVEYFGDKEVEILWVEDNLLVVMSPPRPELPHSTSVKVEAIFDHQIKAVSTVVYEYRIGVRPDHMKTDKAIPDA